MIREVNQQDAQDMALLIKQLSSSNIDITDAMVAAIKAKLSTLMGVEYIKVFGYEQAGNIIGTSTLGRVEGLSNDCRPFAVIENVVVCDMVRGQGIGKQLVCHAMAQAEKWGCYKVILETGRKEEWKLKFYESCGLTRGEKTAFIKRF